jgi:hypothetical protein
VTCGEGLLRTAIFGGSGFTGLAVLGGKPAGLLEEALGYLPTFSALLLSFQAPPAIHLFMH